MKSASKTAKSDQATKADKQEQAVHPYDCPVNTTLELIGGKWKVVILYQLTIKTQRFNELRRLIPEVTQRMLTLQLREMEQDGLIHREVYPVVPPKVEYSLSDFGRTLLPVIQSMHEWGLSYEQECRRILANRKV